MFFQDPQRFWIQKLPLGEITNTPLCTYSSGKDANVFRATLDIKHHVSKKIKDKYKLKMTSTKNPNCLSCYDFSENILIQSHSSLFLAYK